MVFARVNTGIHTSALANSLDKRDCLIGPHRSPWIVTVLLEIEHQQHTRARPNRRVSLCPRTGDNTQEMICLSNRIACIAIMIGSPKQSRLQRPQLSVEIFGVPREGRVRRFMNYADNPLTFNRREVRP